MSMVEAFLLLFAFLWLGFIAISTEYIKKLLREEKQK